MHLNLCDTNCPLNERHTDYDDSYTQTAPVSSFAYEASALPPVPGPFTLHFRPFAAKPLMPATQSGIIGLHDRSEHVQE